MKTNLTPTKRLNRRLLFFCTCLLLFCSMTQAQTFYKTFGSGTIDEGGQAICASPDGNFFVGGYRGDSALVMKVDPAGNTLWSKTFKPHAVSGYINSIVDLVITPDGYLVGCGNAFGGSPATIRVGFMFKFDLNGNLIWKRVSTDIKAMRFIRLLPNQLNQYTLIINYWLGTYPYGDVFNAQVDAATGNITWLGPQMDYMSTNPYQDDLMGGAIGRGGAVYSTGRCYTNGAPQSTMRVFLSKYNATGTHLWSKYLLMNSSANAMMYGQDVLYRNDTVMLSYHGDNNGTSLNLSIGLICCDTMGNVKWSKEYDVPGAREEAYEVLPTSYGYALMGHCLDAADNYIFVVAVDHAGIVLWSKKYGSPTQNEGHAFNNTTIATMDGDDILFTGRIVSGNDDNLLLARTDASGNIACTTVSNLAVTVTDNPAGNYACPVGFTTNTLNTASTLLLQPTNLPAPCSMSNLNLGNDTTTCNPLTLNAAISGATQYVWQDGSAQPTYTVTGPGTYWVNVYFGCCLLSDTIHITGGGSLSAGFSSVQSPCNNTVSFTNLSQNAISYQWDFGDSNGSTQATPSYTYQSTGQYTVTLIATSACGTDTFIQTVTITPPAAAIAGFNAPTVCVNTATGFTNTSSNATSYVWDFGDGSNTSLLNSPSHIYNAAGTYTITLIASSPCSADTIQQTVTVYPAPVVQVTGNDTICQGQPVTLTASGTGSVQWSGGSTAITSTITVSPFSTTTYYAVVSDSLCSSQPDTFTVAVLSTGNAVISGPDSICVGQSVTLTATGGSTYQWSGGSSATTASITVSPNTSTTYYVIAGTGYCAGPPDTVTVTVLPVPVANISGNTTICQGQSTTLTATGGGSYQWSGGSTATTASITVSPNATTTYFVTASNGICSSTFATITVTVTPSPTVTITGNTMICPGSNTTLTAFGANTYVWSGAISSTSQSVTAMNPGNYIVIGYNSQGCADTAHLILGVYDVPTVAILGDDSICNGESTQLLSSGSGTFSWAPSTGLNSTTAQQVVATPSTTTTYTVTVTTSQGCTDSDVFTVYVDQCTGITENTAASGLPAVHPNPGSGLFTIDWPGSEDWTVEVFDMSGRRICGRNAVHTDTLQLDLRTLQQGMYFLVAGKEDASVVMRVVIAR